MSELEFTGERVVPGKVDPPLWEDHVARYRFAATWVRDKSVLDFGCGVGYGSEILRAGGASRVWASDLAIDAVGYGQDHYGPGGVGFAATDCQRTAFADAAVDVVVSFEVIEHVPSYQRFLTEARRILKPDGLLILSTPSRRTYTDDSEGDKNPFHCKEFYYRELEEALAEHFSGALIYGQFVCEGPFFVNLSPENPGATATLLGPVAGAGFRPAPDPDMVDYFTALCSVGPLPTELRRLPHFMSLAGTNELHRLKTRLVGLQGEFDDRTEWAVRLDREVEERGRRILRLQSESNERERWALSLSSHVGKLETRIRELEAALEARTVELHRLESQSAGRKAILETPTAIAEPEP